MTQMTKKTRSESALRKAVARRGYGLVKSRRDGTYGLVNSFNYLEAYPIDDLSWFEAWIEEHDKS